MVYDVITMGSCLVDAFLDTGAKERNDLLSFPIGTKIKVNDIAFSVGGGGTNTAISFSRLGLKTGFLGKTGKGYNAKIIRRGLRKNNVKFLGKTGGGHTGYSIILEGDRKHRTILTYKGESDNLKFSEVPLTKIKTKWLYFTSMSDESFKTQIKLSNFAIKKGIKIAYNPSSYHTNKGPNHLKPLLKNVFVLTLNKEEAGMLTNKKNKFKGLKDLGPQIICITDGEKGGGVYDGNFLYKFYPSNIKAKECTGAGDAFGSSFVYGLISSKSIDESIRIAMANSESVIKQRGAQAGLLYKRDLKKLNKYKIIKQVI